MQAYAAFLRGINVSGNNIIKMEALKKLCALPGFSNITTYIQSGNVLFNTEESDASSLELELEKKLTKTLGYPTPVFLRNLTNMQSILKNDPFKHLRGKDGIKEYVAFLPETPDNMVKSAIENISTEIDIYKFNGRDLYIVIHPEKGKSLFTNNNIEKKLGMPATTRNWRTVNKMLELLKAYRSNNIN